MRRIDLVPPLHVRCEEPSGDARPEDLDFMRTRMDAQHPVLLRWYESEGLRPG